MEFFALLENGKRVEYAEYKGKVYRLNSNKAFNSCSW
jgi:hypothetical protein